MQTELRCPECRGLEEAHEQAMEKYMSLVEEQSLLFRKGLAATARDLDSKVHLLKAQRQGAVDALLQHQARHYPTTRIRNGN